MRSYEIPQLYALVYEVVIVENRVHYEMCYQGNNIRGSATEALGRMLRQNNVLLRY